MTLLALIDCEATSADHTTASLVELACCLWSVEHRTRLRAISVLVKVEENPAEHVNHIPAAAAMAWGKSQEDAIKIVGQYVAASDAVCGHNVDGYDKPLLARLGCPWAIDARPWVDSMTDLEWPVECGSRSLLSIAHAHGVQIGTLHRAGDDVALLASLLERAATMTDVEAMVRKGMRPKALFQALVPFDRKDEAKSAGFRWVQETKSWVRSIARDDVATLPFECRELAA